MTDTIERLAMKCYRKGMTEEQAFEYIDNYMADDGLIREIELVIDMVWSDYIPEETGCYDDDNLHSQTIEDKLREVGMSWRDFL